MKSRLFLLLLLVATFGAILPAVDAQQDTCPALVDRALSTIGTNCANMERNSACYGYNSIEAAFSEDVPDGFFSQPSDRSGLNILGSLQTAPLDERSGKWGIATMNVQASLPGALPGQSLVFIMLGATAVENAVAPEDMLTLPDEPLDVMTVRAAELRLSADPDAEVVGEVESGTPLLADGISPDGESLRVFFMADRLSTAWVPVDDLDSDADLSELPVIGPQSRTPMQAFRFQTGIGSADCAEAPSLLVVQGPENIEVDINANGADIRIGSTIVLRTLPDGSMQIYVLAGGGTLNPDSDNPLALPPGFTSTCAPDEVSDGNCRWSPPRLITPDEQIELSYLQPLFEKASNLLFYTPSVPEVVCASGVGGVICELHFSNPEVALTQAAVQCSMGRLPRSMCSALFPGS